MILDFVTQPWSLATIAPAIPLLILAVAFQPRHLFPPRHRTGKRATRIIRQLQAEYAALPRPTGWQSPAWTVSREAVTR